MNKAIKITIANSAAIEAALHAVNGRATAHAYTAANEVVNASERGEMELEKLGLPKASRSGAFVKSCSGSRVANAYRGIRLGTVLTLERRSSAWYLVGVSQVTLKQEGGRDKLLVSQEQKDQLLARLADSLTVYKPAT